MKKLLFSLGILLLVSPVSSAFANEGTTEIELENLKTVINEDEIKRDELTIKNPSDSQISPNAVPTLAPRVIFMASWSSGIDIVRNRGHLFTAELMTRAQKGPFTLATYSVGSRPSSLISSDSSFKKILQDYRSAMTTGKINSKTYPGSSEFTNGELYSSLQHYNYNITILKNPDTLKWTYYGYITDVYDFTQRNLSGYYDNLEFTLGNNTGAYGLRMGWLQPFDIKIYVEGNL